MTAPPADIVVVGGTPAGCAAAVVAARAGRTVLLLEPTAALGGMNSNGVHTFDSGTPQALGGVAEEFARRVARHYAAAPAADPLTADGQGLYWEAGVAARLWAEWLAEFPAVEVRTGAVACAAEAEGGAPQRRAVARGRGRHGRPRPRRAAAAPPRGGPRLRGRHLRGRPRRLGRRGLAARARGALGGGAARGAGAHI